ncbi:MAG: TIGR00266 family protein [Myxococcales bacterium]|nr:MAG: TIGR00266 family protein [Myxococcales bacterium]
MQVEITKRPAAAIAKVRLSLGETLTAEVGSMVAMSTGLQVETSSLKRGGGSLLKLRRIFAGESFFLNHFTAQTEGQEIFVGPKNIGDVIHHRLESASMIVQGSSWLASTHGIDIDATWQGITAGLFGGEGLFWVKCSGSGDLLLNSFGAIYEIDVKDNYVVDTGHIVAFEDTLRFSVGKATGSWIGSFLGGEGLVCKFSGQGKLYCQTHNPPSFGKLLGPKLKPRN